MTEEDNTCPRHNNNSRRIAFIGILVFVLIAIIVAITVYFVLRPHRPRFMIQDATIYGFKVSGDPYLLNATFQVTVVSRNPNARVGVYYDKLSAYATYNDQQITLRTSIPSSYQGHKEAHVWSPFLFGPSVPIAPYNALSLSRDQSNGTIMLKVKLSGRLRWRVGSITTGSYNIFVECPAFIAFGSSSAMTGGDFNAVKYQMMQRCTVKV